MASWETSAAAMIRGVVLESFDVVGHSIIATIADSLDVVCDDYPYETSWLLPGLTTGLLPVAAASGFNKVWFLATAPKAVEGLTNDKMMRWLHKASKPANDKAVTSSLSIEKRSKRLKRLCGACFVALCRKKRSKMQNEQEEIEEAEPIACWLLSLCLPLSFLLALSLFLIQNCRRPGRKITFWRLLSNRKRTRR
jgi:hypothetical protein